MHVFQIFMSLIYTAVVAAFAGCLGLCCLSHGVDSVLEGNMMYACSSTLHAAILLFLNIGTLLCCVVLGWAGLGCAVLSCAALQHAVLYTMTVQECYSAGIFSFACLS